MSTYDLSFYIAGEQKPPPRDGELLVDWHERTRSCVLEYTGASYTKHGSIKTGLFVWGGSPIMGAPGGYCFISMRNKVRATWRYFTDFDEFKLAIHQELVDEGIISCEP